MIEPSFRTLLVPAIGATSLLKSCSLAATDAAIALPAIAMHAEEEDGATVAAEANPLPENHIAVNRRHVCAQAALDNGKRFVAG